MSTDMTTSDFPAGGLPPELLLDYATGAAAEPVALAVATYLALNPAVASLYHDLNAVGGALLDNCAPAPMSEGALAAILKRLDSVPVEPRMPAALTSDAACRVPYPLQAYIGSSWENLHWKSVTAGVEEYVIASHTRGWRTSLLRIAPGKAMPTHTHAGEEYTIVLDGAYVDENGAFARGSIEVADSSTVHKPVSDPVAGCVCLAVLSAPLQLTGFIGWFVNPFLRH
jgi:putative transcriptional regulator